MCRRNAWVGTLPVQQARCQQLPARGDGDSNLHLGMCLAGEMWGPTEQDAAMLSHKCETAPGLIPDSASGHRTEGGGLQPQGPVSIAASTGGLSGQQTSRLWSGCCPVRCGCRALCTWRQPSCGLRGLIGIDGGHHQTLPAHLLLSRWLLRSMGLL